MPGDAGVPVCSCAFFLYWHARSRVHRAPGISCALLIEGVRISWQNSGAWRREIAGLCHVIASASEAIQTFGAARFWIASSQALLAMTGLAV
jgi:hypothetical protein